MRKTAGGAGNRSRLRYGAARPLVQAPCTRDMAARERRKLIQQSKKIEKELMKFQVIQGGRNRDDDIVH